MSQPTSYYVNQKYIEMENLLPPIFPDTNPVSGSSLNSFVMALATELGTDEKDLADFKDNLTSLTTTTGITAWEDLVGLPERPDLPLTTRRARVFSRLSGTPTTIGTIKNIIRSYVGSDAFSIYEFFHDNNPDTAFSYKITLHRPPTTPYDEFSLQQDIVRVQPAHCGTTVELEDAWNTILSRLNITSTVTPLVQNLFIIGTSLIGGPDVIAPDDGESNVAFRIGISLIGGPDLIAPYPMM